MLQDFRTRLGRQLLSRSKGDDRECEVSKTKGSTMQTILADRNRTYVDCTETNALTYDVADEALEDAAATMDARAAALTISFCSGLDTCPA